MNLKKLLLAIGLLCFVTMQAEEQEKEDYVKFGGAVRFNIFSKSWVDSKTQPEMTIDTWRLNVTARKKGVDLNFEYRFYPTFGTHFMKQGWIGYDFGGDKDLYMKLGVSQVPFGITSYASHSWWFQAPYYVGLEDDYDMGIKFDYDGIENLDLAFAYYRQAEPEGPIDGGDVTYGQAGPGRYSYDFTPVAGAANRELNQLNVRAAYHLGEHLELGLSGQLGGIYNSTVDEMKTATAFAAHVVADVAGFNFKGELVSYNYQAVDDNGADLDAVTMGAYGSTYELAAKANMYVAGLAYTIPVKLGPISSVQAYVDYSFVDKIKDSYEDTHHLIPGMLITAGNIYTYIDYAMGINQPWIGADWNTGLSTGDPNADWQKRLNINIGYYF